MRAARTDAAGYEPGASTDEPTGAGPAPGASTSPTHDPAPDYAAATTPPHTDAPADDTGGASYNPTASGGSTRGRPIPFFVCPPSFSF